MKSPLVYETNVLIRSLGPRTIRREFLLFWESPHTQKNDEQGDSMIYCAMFRGYVEFAGIEADKLTVPALGNNTIQWYQFAAISIIIARHGL